MGLTKVRRNPMTIEKEAPDMVTNTKFAEKDQLSGRLAVRLVLG